MMMNKMVMRQALIAVGPVQHVERAEGARPARIALKAANVFWVFAFVLRAVRRQRVAIRAMVEVECVVVFVGWATRAARRISLAL
jgi:hypothetical protein